MKTIGFIDYYIDEWHAHNYPAMIRQSALGSEFRISLAWAQTDPAGKMPLSEWCGRNEVAQAKSLEQVVESCDCLVVLSPDNPEKHEELADLPLRSGKPVYIDKPIAPTAAVAMRLFEKADLHRSPMMSCSALRFAPALVDASSKATGPATFASIAGGGVYDIYAIHQVEMLVILMGIGAKRVLRERKGGMDTLIVDYADDRRGMITLFPGHPFQFSAKMADKTVASGALADFFPRFIDGLLTFFKQGKPLVPADQTLEIASIVEAGRLAGDRPLAWVDVPVLKKREL